MWRFVCQFCYNVSGPYSLHCDRVLCSFILKAAV